MSAAADLGKHGPRTGLHNRRHTHAVLLLEQRVPIEVVADRLGDADPTATMRVYQHVTEQAAQLAVTELEIGLKKTPSASPADSSVTSDTSEFVASLSYGIGTHLAIYHMSVEVVGAYRVLENKIVGAERINNSYSNGVS